MRGVATRGVANEEGGLPQGVSTMKKSGSHEGRRQRRSQVATQGVSIKSQVATRIIAGKGRVATRGGANEEVGLPWGVVSTKRSGCHEGHPQRRSQVAMRGIANEEGGLPKGAPMKKSGCHEGRCQQRSVGATRGVANEEVGLPQRASPMK